MKRVLFTFILTLCATTFCMGKNLSSHITAFYKTYLTNVLTDITNGKNNDICDIYLTKEARDQVKELIRKTGADPIIRAQDANKTAVKTVHVEQLKDDCYLVTYLWDMNNSNSITKIPLKAKIIDGRCKITYFAPEPLETIEE